MKKQIVSLLLVVVVLASSYALLGSANPLSTITKTLTTTYPVSVTRSTTVRSIYATYTTTKITYHTASYARLYAYRRVFIGPFDLKKGDTIEIAVSNAKGSMAYIDGPSGSQGNSPLAPLEIFEFYSDEYAVRTFKVRNDGFHQVSIFVANDNLQVSIRFYGIRTYTVTSSSFMVEQYLTSVGITEDVLTKTETVTERVTDYYASPITIIAIVAVAAVVVVVAFMKRKPKAEQTQLEKFASS